MSRRDLERAAQAYATNGFDVFPVSPRVTKPLHKGWQREATQDPAAVHELWQRDPDARIGVKTGDGLVILDADRPGVLDALELPDTTTVRTRRGIHAYLRGDAPNRVGVLDGLDVRGRGGFAVGAGSRHIKGGSYKWIIPPWEVPPAPAPAQVIDLATRRRDKTTTTITAGPIPAGQRNTTLTRLAGAMRRQGMHVAEVRAGLHAVNTGRCRPALPTTEVDRIAASSARFAAGPPWLDALTFADDPNLDHRARLVLIALCRRANDKGHVIGGDWLPRQTGLHANRISEAVRRLEHAGRVSVQRQRRQPNRYKLENARIGAGEDHPLDRESGTSLTHSVNQDQGRAA